MLGILLCVVHESHAQQLPAACVLQMTAQSPICAGSCSALTNTSYGPLGNGDTACFPNFYWDAPGGIPSSYLGFSPGCITYNSPGSYLITLYSVDAQGNIEDSNFVSANVTVLGPPDAGFTYSPQDPCMLDLVVFDVNDSTLNPNNYITWDFGDGNLGNGPHITNQYQNQGTYTVTCCVGNACDTLCTTQIITVHDGSPHFTWTSACERVDFTPDSICDQLIITHF